MLSQAKKRFKNRLFGGAVGIFLAASFLFQSFVVTAEQPAQPSASHPLQVFQQREDLLFRVGYLLATSNAAFCENRIAVSGFLHHDAEAYGEPAAVRYLFGLVGDIGIQSVAPGSPAYEAGLRQNDTLISLANEPVAERWVPTNPGWKRASAIDDTLEAALAKGPVTVVWANANGFNAASLQPAVACASRFELIGSSKTASADGNRVIIGKDFPGFAYEEDEFAAAIAHEMAHNLLGHHVLLERTGRNRESVRLSERDADRLMPWLLANAGYEPAAAVRFMKQWGPKHGGGIFRKRTHDGWDERVEFIEAELSLIESELADHGAANWKEHFRPMLRSDCTGPTGCQ